MASEKRKLNLNQFYQDDDEWDEDGYDDAKSLEERYQSPELIASGGMKDIYKTYDTMTCRHIAMAQLRKDVPEEHCESFMKEAYLTASMEHPNIISVYDVGLKDNNEPYFTMELKVGNSLTDLMDKDNVVLTELLEIFLKICDAISYAHSCDNLHLDIKPDNIQVGTFGEVQVCDWGLGSRIDDPQNGQAGVIKGTPGYMAPEQGMPNGIVDKQTDVYALGALLYSLLTGKIPVEGGLHTIISNTVNGRLEFPIERFPDKKIPESLDAVVRKAMAYEKQGRYGSVDLLKNEVNKFLTGYSTEAENAGFLKEFSLFYKRNKAISQVVFLAILLIGFGSTYFILKLQKSNRTIVQALDELTESYDALKVAQENEKKAQENEKKANQKSTQISNKYREQQVVQKQVSRDLHDEKFERAYELTLYPKYFSSPIAMMDEALADLKGQYAKTGKPYIAKQIVINLFISQKFTEISNYEVTEIKTFTDLAKNYTEFKTSKKGGLKDYRFLRILRDLNALPVEQKQLRHLVMERMIYYQMELQKTDFTSLDVVKELIKCWNPDWSTEQMAFDSKNLTLTLTGKNLKKLIAKARHSSKICFLRLIKVDSLSVRGTSLESMDQFLGINVKELDIRDTAINRIPDYRALTDVSTLIIDEDQFEKPEIRKASDSTKIIKRPLN